jgi:hypothetical protein
MVSGLNLRLRPLRLAVPSVPLNMARYSLRVLPPHYGLFWK